MITTLFQDLTSIGEGFVDFVVGLFESIVSMFWTAGVDGSGGSFTFIGTFVLIGLVAGLFFFGLSWLFRVINLR